jgi:NitT/TauT family transport system substrate-binding protein
VKRHKNAQKWMLSGIILMYLALGCFPLNIQAQTTNQDSSLKVALLPILDAFPYFVAEAKGYFNEYGVSVKAVPVASGLERDQLMQSGEIDGMLNEMISTANFNRDRIQVKSVMSARKAAADHPLFRLLSAPGSKLRSALDLTGIPIGISKNTIIEYVTDRLLTASGLESQTIVKKSVPAIPERYQLLIQGRLKAATLPDPLAKSALEAGAGELVADSSHPDYSVSVLSFNVNALNHKTGAVRLFLKAWDRAAAAINSNPESFRALLLEKIRVPKNIQRTYKIPTYPRRQVPDASQWADVIDWMKANDLLESAPSYGDSVTNDYLPQ